MTDTDPPVTDLAVRRLAALRPLEQTYKTTMAATRAARIEHGPLADEYRAYAWSKTSAEATGEPFEGDDILERNGQAAQDAIEAAFQAMRTAQQALGAEIARMCADAEFVEGDTILARDAETVLTVASIYRAPEATLSEVTFTADGLPIVKEQHSWSVVDGKVVVVLADGATAVKYERWWQGGLRVAGTCHSESRKLIDVD
jgi:hypothetical protein